MRYKQNKKEGIPSEKKNPDIDYQRIMTHIGTERA